MPPSEGYADRLEGCELVRETKESALDALEPTDVILARAVLKRHYGEPVLSLKQFCDIFSQWGEAIHEAWQQGRGLPGLTPGADWHHHRPAIMLAAAKSSLLGRMLAGEELRTEICPEHNGHWSGLPVNHDCVHGCDLTGWIR